jgi:nicotinate-nucleotide pyrophosphorylase (carboxylating)
MISPQYVQHIVQIALDEDIGSGDITAALVAESTTACARVITREPGVLCGTAFVDETFRAIDASLCVTWHKADGDLLAANDLLFTVSGSARHILTGERTALNFLQLLSGTATRCKHYANLVADTEVKLLDTRKTIPALRLAQKYAVSCGGCYNHRIGLYDAFLIKENHIQACGGIAGAVATARQHSPGKPVEVEVENFGELRQALAASADRIMLDNFSNEMMREAVAMVAGKAELEASGNVTEATLKAIAETGVNFISIGALTKGVEPLDLSMRFND